MQTTVAGIMHKIKKIIFLWESASVFYNTKWKLKIKKNLVGRLREKKWSE